MDLLVLAAGGLLSANAGLAFWLAIAFILLVILLGKFAWGPITSALAEREQTIEESISRAERANAEAQALLAQNDSARRDAEAQARQILAEAKAQADRQHAEAKAELDVALAEHKARAEAEIEQQKRQVLGEIRAEVADMAVTVAEKILRKEIGGAEQSAFVDRFIADLPQN